MDIAHPISSKPKSVSFGFLTTDEIKKISVKQIVNPSLLDNTGRPTVGGLYDPALGPSDRGDICATCGLTSFNCPGHFGHIELPTVNYHPLFFTHCFNMLRGVCLYCHHFKLDPAVVTRYVAKLSLLDYGLIDEAEQVDLIKRGVSEAEEEDATSKMSKSALKALEKERELEAYKSRVNSWVKFNVSKAQQNGKTRDEYKSGLVYQTRKRLFHQLFRQMYRKKCDNCNAHAHAFRKEGSIKIIEYSLTPKQEAQHNALGLSRPDVLKEQAVVDKNAREALKKQTQVSKDSDSSSEDEDDGEDTQSNNGDITMNDSNDTNGDVNIDDEEDIAAIKANNKNNAALLKRSERVVPASEVQAHLHRLFTNEKELTSMIFSRHGPFPTNEAMADIFFMSAIPVPPTRFRPAARMGDALMEHPQNELLGAVLQTSLRIRDYNNEMSALNDKDYAQTMAANSSLGENGIKIIRDRTYQRLLEELITLQHGINSFIDSSKNPARLPQGREPTPGVKQVLEKKEGLFRKHMMGKRVNYAARSVISPDVNIETSEIGVPPVFAKTLTYPEPVTPFNVSYLRKLVINGPKNYPGASMIQYEDGRMESLEKKSQEQRTAIANQLLTPSNRPDNQNKMTTRTSSINKKVFRHLRDGDVLLLNRQPTLHKPSMMAHKAKVLHGERTIRMHYANCKSYNADFDGDEMNMHFAQSAIAKAEMMFIANNDNQYLVPTSGKPLRGLIQDHVVAGSWMTMKSTFFTRDEYQQLLYGALRPENDYTGEGRVHLLPPAIWKPQPLWTGKQIISTVLKNITPSNARGLNLESESKVKAEYLPAWGSNENKVIIVDGVVCSGIIDSSQFGTSSYGLVHSVFELYGSECAGKLLSILSRLFTKYLQHRGFTCRMDDLILTDEGNEVRDEILEGTKNYGFEAAIDSIGLTEEQSKGSEGKRNVLMRLEEVLRDDNKLAMLDQTSTSKNEQIKSQILKKTLPAGLWRRFPTNHFQAMVLTGSKGSAVNASQISCLLGQQSLEGRRVPVMVSGKTLPCFKPFETDMRAGGFVAQRFLTGIRPQEYYFHCMAGREGLIDTAVKTANSGYLQRCLIKHLEGIKVHYDHTVRDSDNSVIQFQYGEDALDVTKQVYLNKYKFAVNNYDSMMRKYNPKALIGKVDEEAAEAYMKKALKKPYKYAPVLSEYSPSVYLGATSEKFAKDVDAYAENNPDGLLIPQSSKKNKLSDAEIEALVKKLKQQGGAIAKPKQFKNLLKTIYARSLVEPGEAVGLLASQGVGEPSTQMTLNTFHFAGHGAANVTLGIPRLREIVMTASAQIKTPTMKLPVFEHITEEEMKVFCKNLNKLTLAECVDDVRVIESLSSKTPENGFSRRKTYKVHLNLYDPNEYSKEYNVEPYDVCYAMKKFTAILDKEITIELRKVTREQTGSAANIGRGQRLREKPGENENNGDEDAPVKDAQKDDDNEGDEGDAESRKRIEKTKEIASYSDDEASDEEDQKKDDDNADDSDKESDIQDDDERHRKHSKKLGEKLSELEDKIVQDSHYMTKLDCDREGGYVEFELEFSSKALKMLLVGIIEKACRKTVVHEVPGISRAILLDKEKNKDGSVKKQRSIQTEGANLMGIRSFGQDFIDLNQLYSNDIDAIRRTYGVEAARASIINEVAGIFQVYGIGVDFRHLALLADYMTYDGGYKPFNRTGLSGSPSPLLRASFETTASIIAEAALFGDFDDMKSPASSIVMGCVPEVGTGLFNPMNLNWIFFVTKALANLLEIDDQNSCQKPGSCLANHTIYDIADVAIESDTLSTELPTNEGIDNLDLEILPNLELGPTSTPPAPLPIPTSPLKDRFNHASSDCAAVILQSTPNSKGASSILSEKKDRYMLSPCNASKRWVITELCNEIRIDTVELANYEFFSGAFKKFTVSVSRSWPVSDEGWLTVGEFRAKNIRGVQTFQLPRPTPDFYRYLRIDFLDHYGNEYYCPLSLLRVYGVDQMEAFRLEEDVESVNNAKEDTPIVVHDDFEDLHKFLENSQYQDDIYVSPEEIEAFETTLYQEDLISPAFPPPNAHLKNINETDFGEFEPTKSSSQQHQQPQRTPSQVNAGESIYRTINKRLATLETQSQMLSRALKDSRLAQRGLSGKVEALALRNEVRLAETMKTLERAHKETQDERDRLKSEVSYLTSEVGYNRLE
ncbi:beta and beta-prime subunits of DNA dependent RNA-polymerase [Wallemia mellicola]|nr:beta and beta-prime subunits of DNA dependent RNA-polymerase [Wallemia mellicola]